MSGEPCLKTADFARATFLRSVPDFRDLPPGGLEIAFVGRSNAGKSSAINAITRPGLARVSKTPGRTQLLNVFTLAPMVRLVDLPGYGYARVPDAVKATWAAMATRYLERRNELAALVLIVDARRGLEEADERLMALWRPRRRPLHVVLTKADQAGRGPAKDMRRRVEASLDDPHWTAQLFSAHTQEGIESLQEQIMSWAACPWSGSR